MPKIAIITPCYNAHPDLILAHFMSLDRQHCNDSFIHIVVDDASTNEETRVTLAACCQARKANTVLISMDTQSGPGAARNRAIRFLAKLGGIEYACLLDIDDYFESDALSVREAILDKNEELVAVYGHKYSEIRTLVNNELEVASKILEETPVFDKPKLMRECYIPSCSVMFRWGPFIKYVGEFREDVRLCEDWLVWRKLSMLGRFKRINIPVYTQTLNGNNLTTNKSVLANHHRDMITTKLDFDEWLFENAPKGILQP